MFSWEASGTRGGIVIMWDKRVWEGVLSSVGMFSVTCSFSGKCQDISIGTLQGFMPQMIERRGKTWWEIAAARGLVSGPCGCVICEDFQHRQTSSRKEKPQQNYWWILHCQGDNSLGRKMTDTQ